MPTRTETSGHSVGGAQTTTHTEYQEQTVTNGQAFSNSEAWRNGTATAQDTAHAADLWFSFKVRNRGADYAREISGLVFNVFIGDDPSPVCSYLVGSSECALTNGGFTFTNLLPNAERSFTSARINLTLDQMRTIDLGGKVRIVPETFSYGADQIMYENAVNSGVLVAIEDGPDDGDENVDTYLIPTWGDGDTVQDVLLRFFPAQTDAGGNPIAVMTPERLNDRPGWCQPPSGGAVEDPKNPYDKLRNPVWCRHALSTADWWNIYLNNLGDGTSDLKDTPVKPNSTAFFRFNKDSDLDGYSDRTELRLGTDPRDPASHPKPELIGGVHCDQAGTKATCTLSLQNTGPYDAYGVEAVMVAPDSSISITNNTVGGSGRVRAFKQVNVGSSIKAEDPLPPAWAQAGHARPAAGGYFTGGTDRTYSFTVQCPDSGGCEVGKGTWTLRWSDDASPTPSAGTLDVGSTYKSPTLLDVAQGVKLSLLSGKAFNNETFRVFAKTPRDTFQYTINQGSYTPPLVIVSYNDPQGNHRFVVPPEAMALGSADAPLAPRFSGKMLPNPGVEISTSGVVAAGGNSTALVVNNPTETTLTDAKLFLEFIDPSGTVVREEPVTRTLPPGPSIAPISWNTSTFSPAYDSTKEYIVLAFLTDYQGNILDTAGRPLSSFQKDPAPAFAASDPDLTWDFGQARQGTLLQHEFALGSTGFLELLTYVGKTTGISVTAGTGKVEQGTGNARLSPGDVGLYTVAINTEALPAGAFNATIPIRTSDAANQTKNITITGTVLAAQTAPPVATTLRPLDWPVTLSGNKGDWVTFTQNIDTQTAQSLHPVKVLSDDYAAEYGVGKYAAAFGTGTASADMFGNGQDGDKTAANGEDLNPIRASASGNAASTTLAITNVAGTFAANTKVMIHQTRGANAGVWELNDVVSAGAGQLTLKMPLKNTYTTDGGANRAQVLWVPQQRNLTVNTGVTVSPKAWDGNAGGIVAFLANGTVTVAGTITGSGKGFRGGVGAQSAGTGTQGEGTSGTGSVSNSAIGSGGGGGTGSNDGGSGGGGGSHATVGINGENKPGGGGTTGGKGATSIVGSADLTTMVFGGAGGGGGADDSGGPSQTPDGGNSGGIIVTIGATVIVTGSITSRGSNGVIQGANSNGNTGGGGSGGSILLEAQTATLGAALIIASGGTGGNSQQTANQYAAGDGRVHLAYCDSLTGTTTPAASTQKLNCYIAEQVETAPFTTTRVNLPLSGTQPYRVQYGRRASFAAAGSQTPALSVPKQSYTTASLDLLSTGASAPVTVSLDVGNDGTVDFTSAPLTLPAKVPVSTPGVLAALNNYLAAQTAAAQGSAVDMPVKITVSGAADVILTNLVLSVQSGPLSNRLLAVDTGAERPLDYLAQVLDGTHNAGDPVTFQSGIGPAAEAASLHPCKVYDATGTVLKGVGKNCTDFGQGTAAGPMFGDGRDGDVTAQTGGQFNPIFASASGSKGATTLTLSNEEGGGFVTQLRPDMIVLVHQSRGANAGASELNRATAVPAGQLTLAKPLTNDYSTDSGANRAQVLWVPQYRNVTVPSGQTISPAHGWNGNTGGIIAFLANGTATVNGAIDLKGANGAAGGYASGGLGGIGTGFRGGDSQYSIYASNTGEGTAGHSGSPNSIPNGNGGGSAAKKGDSQTAQTGGGGGGNGSPGSSGSTNEPNNHDPGQGGTTAGSADLAAMVFGGGGGSGALYEQNAGGGGAAGGWDSFRWITDHRRHWNNKS